MIEHGSSILLPLRRAGDIPLAANHPLTLARADYDRTVVELAARDRELLEIVERRRATTRRLAELTDRLWPMVFRVAGRRPPPPEQLPLPPISVGAQYLMGRPLRSVCLTLLGRHGACELAELHRLLHLYGFQMASDHPVKCLADAMAYETEKKRAIRIGRGRYTLHPHWRPRRRGHGDAPLGLPPDLAVPLDHILQGRELPHAHGSPGVEHLSRDADLGTEAELFTVDEPSGGVDEDSSGVDLTHEAIGGAEIAGDDRFGVTRTEPGDVIDRRVERGHDSDRELQGQELLRIVVVGRHADRAAGKQSTRLRVANQLDLVERGGDLR
jgi:hypothetical protein